MGSYLGYGLQAGVQGFQSGFNMGQMKWQRNEKKRLEKKQEELMESSTIFNNMVSTAGDDGFYSDDEQMKINAAYTALTYEVKERVDGSMKAMQAMDKKTVEANNQWMDYIREGIEGLDAKNVQGIFDFVRPNIQGEKGLLALDALESITKKRQGIVKEEKAWEQVGKLPSGMRVPYLEQEGIPMPEPPPEAPADLSVADKKYNWAIDNYKAGKISFEQLSNFMGTAGGGTQDLTAKQQEVELMKQHGATTEEIKNKLLGISKAGVTPEGEITAGQKRSWDMASSVMFGSSDWVTGISKPGIISQNISNKLNMGQVLTEEENTEIRNNYNAIRETLPDEIKSIIESQLRRYGISLEAPIATPEPVTTTPEKQPGMIEKGVTAVKDWLGMKGTPEAGETGKDYTTMEEEELYNLAIAGDKLAYEEAKRRGLIK